MKIRMILAALLCSAALVSAQSLFTANLTPDQDGGGARTGSGFVTLTLNGTTLTLSGSFSGLSANSSAAHIHGPSGLFPASAGVLYNLGGPIVPTGGTSGTFSGSVNLVPLQTGAYTVQEQLDDLNNQQWYINVHSSGPGGTGFPGGEIRGQIVPVPEPSTWALMGFGALGLLWSVRRKKA
jgi:CHRD domain/PEP-CTERM motif